MLAPSALLRRIRGRCADRPTIWATATGAALVVVGVVLFIGLLDAVRERDDIFLADAPVLAWLVASRGPVATTVFSVITVVAGPYVLPVIVAVGCLCWFLLGRERWRPMLLVGAVIVSTSLSLVIKGLVARPRPPVDVMVVPGAETTASFPSGHTIGAATLLLVAAYLVLSRRAGLARMIGWGIGAPTGILAVGLSRLYLGYHFLTDVLAALALAVAIGGIVIIVDRVRVLRGLPAGEPAPRWCPRADSNCQPTD